MYIKVTRHIFTDAMRGSFSWGGAKALFEYLEDREEGGEKAGLEFDEVSIRGEFTEYSSATAAAQDYGWEDEAAMYYAEDKERDADEIEEENEEAALKWLNRRTSVIEFSGGVIIGSF